MTRDWSLVIFGLFLVAACALVGEQTARGITIGSLGEWVGGLGTVGALLVAIHLARSDARRETQRDVVLLRAAALMLQGPIGTAKDMIFKVELGRDLGVEARETLAFCERHHFFVRIKDFDPTQLPDPHSLNEFMGVQIAAQGLHDFLVSAQTGPLSAAQVMPTIKAMENVRDSLLRAAAVVERGRIRAPHLKNLITGE